MAEMGPLWDVTLYVEDLRTQVRFYCETLGLNVKAPLGVQHLGELHWVELDTGVCTVALHSAGQRRIGADAPDIVFGVDDVAAMRDELLRRGVVMGEITSPPPGIPVCDGINPERNRFSVESRKSFAA